MYCCVSADNFREQLAYLPTERHHNLLNCFRHCCYFSHEDAVRHYQVTSECGLRTKQNECAWWRDCYIYGMLWELLQDRRLLKLSQRDCCM
jgi:hypothetical protein